MKNILMAVIMAGLSGAAYAGVAAEQLGLNKEGGAVDIPAVSAAVAVPGTKLTASSDKLTVLKGMFETGTVMSYQQLADMLHGRWNGTIAGSFVSNVLDSRKETETINIVYSQYYTGGGEGPLWPREHAGYGFAVTIARYSPFKELMYNCKVTSQPSDKVETLNMKGVTYPVPDMWNLSIEFRRSGNYMVGRLNGGWEGKSGDAYFYLWNN